MGRSSRYEVLRFPFPIRKIPPELADSEWARVTLGLDSKGVRNLLASRWPVPADPALALLRQKFLTYTPVAIVTYDLRDYLQLDHPEVTGDSEVGDSYYVASPVPREEVEATMTAALGDREIRPTLSPAFVEFHSLFPDLREDFQTSGHFIRPEEWKTLAEEMEDCEELEETGDWQDALWIYHGRNGDMLVLSPSGAVAWYSLGENEITPIADSFGDFLRHFVDHLEKRWPLDSYGP